MAQYLRLQEFWRAYAGDKAFLKTTSQRQGSRWPTDFTGNYMADFLTLVGAAVETVRKLRAIAEKVKDAETRSLMADLHLQLADIKTEAARLLPYRI
jgi:hypothetical protein